MPVRKDKDGRWHAEVCVGRRRLHRRLPEGATASDAKRTEAELRRALHASATRAPVIPGDPMLVEVMADYCEYAKGLRSPESAQQHAHRIGRWLESRRASETREVAAKIIDDLRTAYRPATINRSLGTLKKGLRRAFEYGRTHTDYSVLVKRLPENNQRTVYLTMEEVKKIADHASENVRAAIWISLLTGCRRGEVCKITAEDIGRDAIRIQAGNTKTLRYREMPIVPALRPWLRYLPMRINFEGVKSGFRRAREAAGMAHVHFHDLRHSCATIMLGVGVPMHVVREILGHSSIRTTERYAHVLVAPQRAALKKLGDLHRNLHRTQKSRSRSAATH
ncbi:integrase family protein [Burkholderiales bacterium GJ-E10]|nr:integrase family protein [Burkholderiales bacterium GJ-E10]